MCRRCGEPDRRGSSADRRRLKLNLIARDGDIEAGTVPCTWQAHPKCPKTLTFATMERDRIVPGGPYRLDNLVASCGPCNRQRNYTLTEIADGCIFGPVGDDTWPTQRVTG